MSDEKILVVTTEPLSVEQLRAGLGVESNAAEVLVVAPALHASGLRFWMSDADEAIAHARWVADSTADNLNEAGIEARADTGEGDPLDAVADVLATFPASRILLFSRPEEEQRYRESIDSGELQQRFGVTVEQVERRNG